MPKVVAQITKDRLHERWTATGGEYNNAYDSISMAGKEFHYQAMINWWGWGDIPNDSDWLGSISKTAFKLYDDDDELYYEGWLLNDDECLVQQFVLDWAKYDSGCTTITTLQEDGNYIQEIG